MSDINETTDPSEGLRDLAGNFMAFRNQLLEGGTPPDIANIMMAEMPSVWRAHTQQQTAETLERIANTGTPGGLLGALIAGIAGITNDPS